MSGSVPSGLTITDIHAALDAIHTNFDGGASNSGYLKK